MSRLIDADALKKAITQNREIDRNAVCDVLDIIDNAPTVNTKSFANVIFDKDELEQIVKDRVIEPIKNGELVVKGKRPRGEWIKGREISRTMIGNNIEHIDYKDYTCSNCGLVLDYLLYNQDGSAFYKFCPNCGADMRKETDND